MSLMPAAKPDLVTQAVEGELLVYDPETTRAHCLNASAAVVFRHCNGVATVTETRSALGSEVDVEVDNEWVALAVDRLGDAGLLVSSPVVSQSRRDAFKRIALAATVLPVVASILAPTAAHAASGEEMQQQQIDFHRQQQQGE